MLLHDEMKILTLALYMPLFTEEESADQLIAVALLLLTGECNTDVEDPTTQAYQQLFQDFLIAVSEMLNITLHFSHYKLQ